jgi:restriction endonuclease S subunit
VVTIGALQQDGISRDRLKYVREEKARELDRYRLSPGDVLFSRMATVGRVGIVNAGLAGAIFNYHIIRLRLDHELIDPDYFVLFARTSRLVREYLRSVNRGATRDGINTSLLLQMPIDLPPLEIQRDVVDDVERVAELVRLIARIVDKAGRQAEALRASLLEAAFNGKLFVEDPNDKPPGLFSDRIAAERGVTIQRSRTRQRGTLA